MTLLQGILSLNIFAKEVENTKPIVGEVEYIEIEELGFGMMSRIDTGAETTSIHAKNIKVEGYKKLHKDIRKHLKAGESVTYTVVNDKGEDVTKTSKIERIARIRNAQGVERRFVVNMTLIWDGNPKTVEVNLRNRKKLDYKLLIGRNWLSGSYLVDVEKEPTPH